VKVTEAELRAMRERVGSAVNRGTLQASLDSRHTQQEGLVCGTGQPTKHTKPISPLPYRSKLEQAYAGYLHVLMLAGDILLYRYEPMTFSLGGVRYTPDFMVLQKDSSVEFHEVKGFSKQLLSRAGMVKVKVAANHYPWWKFVLVTRFRSEWRMRELSA
jgi:hypothetical protein